MIDIIRALGERGETAMRRGLWSLAGVSVFVLALGFLAGAAVEFLATLMPRFAALGLIGLLLAILALICFARAPRRHETPPAPSAVAALSALEQGGDWKSALQIALIDEARERPARAAALAALAGLILGALEGFNEQAMNKADKD